MSFGDILDILEVWGGEGEGAILLILEVLEVIFFFIFWVLRVFWSFLGFGGILVIFRFRGYFGHLRGFGGCFAHCRDFGGILVILVIFWVLGDFWLFFGF